MTTETMMIPKTMMFYHWLAAMINDDVSLLELKWHATIKSLETKTKLLRWHKLDFEGQTNEKER